MAASGDGREGWASGFRRDSGSVTSSGCKWGPGGFSVILAPECWIAKRLGLELEPGVGLCDAEPIHVDPGGLS